jgi:hypothetical protein
MKTSNMKRTAGVLALLVLFGGAEAIAQSGMNKGGSLSTGQTINGGIPDAPIGHRQPRAGDVPSEKNLSNPNDPMNKEDAALDKKIKSICRGC